MTPVIHASAVHDVEFKPINQTKSFKTSQMRNLIKLCPDCQQTFTDRLVLLRCELYYLQAYHEHPWCNNFGKKKKKHPTFSLNFFHILTYPFLILFRPKRTLPFMRNVWLGIYHYDNHARCCIISSETFHLKARRLSQGQYFQIHYYFAQTVISTGNLHLAVAVRMPWE